jgi:hypothetical protein
MNETMRTVSHRHIQNMRSISVSLGYSPFLQRMRSAACNWQSLRSTPDSFAQALQCQVFRPRQSSRGYNSRNRLPAPVPQKVDRAKHALCAQFCRERLSPQSSHIHGFILSLRVSIKSDRVSLRDLDVIENQCQCRINIRTPHSSISDLPYSLSHLACTG